MSERIIKTPHLPQGKVGLAAFGAKYREILEKPLQNLGITPLWLPDNEAVDPRLAGHADLMLLHLGGARVVTSCGGEIPADAYRPRLRCHPRGGAGEVLPRRRPPLRLHSRRALHPQLQNKRPGHLRL